MLSYDKWIWKLDLTGHIQKIGKLVFCFQNLISINYLFYNDLKGQFNLEALQCIFWAEGGRDIAALRKKLKKKKRASPITNNLSFSKTFSTLVSNLNRTSKESEIGFSS